MSRNDSENKAELLVEIVLGLLSKPSTLQRKLAEQVFVSFAPNMTSAGLDLLVDVLLTPETISGGKDLFKHDVEEDDDADGDEDEDEDDAMEGEEESIEDAAEEDMDEGMDVVSDDADEELDNALSAALGTTKEILNGTAENTEEEEDLMDDDQMMALDESLATIFRNRLKPNRAKEAKDTKQQIATFKCKVIDLLEILVKMNSQICPMMVLPLLHVLRLTKSDVVHSKTVDVLRKLSKSKQLPDTPPEDLISLLRKIHADAAKARARDSNIHSQLSIYIARIARKTGQEDEVVGVYAESMCKWIKNGKSMVRAGLFSDWVNWCQSIRR